MKEGESCEFISIRYSTYLKYVNVIKNSKDMALSR